MDRTKLCKPLIVSHVKQETTDAVTLTLNIPATLRDTFQYKAGQFVTFFLEINNEEIRRSYSLATSPDFDTDFKVTVKKVSGGKGSTFLTEKVRVGDTLWATPPAGHFCLPSDLPYKNLVFYAAGSGITPIYSLLKSALKKAPHTQCTLIYQNKNQEQTIYREELQNLEKQFPDRLHVVPIYTNPNDNWTGLRGRIDDKKIQDVLTKNVIGVQSLHFMCGPDGFMQTIIQALKDLQFPSERILRESFAPATPPATTTAPAPELDVDGIVIGDKTDLGTPEEIEVTLDGETQTVPYIKKTTVLESLLEAGLNPPYSCMDGACLACLAKVNKGAVCQNDLGILSDENVQAKECLTCQARPLSKKVHIDFSVF